VARANTELTTERKNALIPKIIQRLLAL